MKFQELLETKPQTISGATENGYINRRKAEYIIDPKGIFQKNKRKLRKTHKTASS